MLGLLLLVLVLWIALGLDRSRRYRLNDQAFDVAGRHRHCAVPRHRRRRRDGTPLTSLIKPADRPVPYRARSVRRGVWRDSFVPASFQERRGTAQEAMG